MGILQAILRNSGQNAKSIETRRGGERKNAGDGEKKQFKRRILLYTFKRKVQHMTLTFATAKCEMVKYERT